MVPVGGDAPAGLEKKQRTGIARLIRWAFAVWSGGKGRARGAAGMAAPWGSSPREERRRNKGRKEGIGDRNKPLGRGRARVWEGAEKGTKGVLDGRGCKGRAEVEGGDGMGCRLLGSAAGRLLAAWQDGQVGGDGQRTAARPPWGALEAAAKGGGSEETGHGGQVGRGGGGAVGFELAGWLGWR